MVVLPTVPFQFRHNAQTRSVFRNRPFAITMPPSFILIIYYIFSCVNKIFHIFSVFPLKFCVICNFYPHYNNQARQTAVRSNKIYKNRIFFLFFLEIVDCFVPFYKKNLYETKKYAIIRKKSKNIQREPFLYVGKDRKI